jgi:hypothetical protein
MILALGEATEAVAQDGFHIIWGQWVSSPFELIGEG